MVCSEPVDVLLVEDNASDAELALRALRKSGMAGTVYVASDGVEALDFIFCSGNYSHRSIKDLPRVVFLDLKLPRLGGKEVLKRIKSDARTRKLPVVIMTSSQEESDILESYDAGANSYIVKPVEFEEFMTKISQLGLYWTVFNKSPAS